MVNLIIEILVSTVGILMSLGYYPQAYKMFKNKSATNISKTSYWIFSIGSTIWVLYGILIRSWVIISSFIFGLIGSWTILILSYKYATNRKNKK